MNDLPRFYDNDLFLLKSIFIVADCYKVLNVFNIIHVVKFNKMTIHCSRKKSL